MPDCFFIGPIGEEESPERARTERLLTHIVGPALKEHGFDVAPSHRIDEPGRITKQVIERILGVELVVADLTDHNPNVFFELGIRHLASFACDSHDRERPKHSL